MKWDFRKPDPLGVFQPYFDDWWSNEVSARTKYVLRTGAEAIPFVGPVLQAYDNMQYMDDYTRNRGIGYDEILYPSRTQGAQGYGQAVNFVSRNVIGLYKEDKRIAERRRAANSRNRRRSRTYF